MTKAVFDPERRAARLTGGLVVVAALTLSALTLPALAQEVPATPVAATGTTTTAAATGTSTTAQGGLQLRFDLALQLESDDNAALNLVSAGRTNRAAALLSFNLASTTPETYLTLDGGAELAATSGPAATAEGLVNPYLALSWGRDVANAAISVTASWREADLNGTRSVTDFDPSGGTRQTTGLDATLAWGKTAPLGFQLTAGLSEVNYQASPGNIDNRTTRLGLSARADLSEVMSLTAGLRTSRYEEPTTGTTRDTLGFDLGLGLQRPRGDMNLTLSFSDTKDGEQLTLRLRQNLQLPRAILSYNLGLGRGVTGASHALIGIDYQEDFGFAQIGFSADRSVAPNSTNSESVQSRLSATYSQGLTPRTSLNLSLAWAEQENTATGLTRTNTDLTARLSHALTPDWALDLGYTHRIRDTGGTSSADSDRVFLTLRRSFQIW